MMYSPGIMCHFKKEKSGDVFLLKNRGLLPRGGLLTCYRQLTCYIAVDLLQAVDLLHHLVAEGPEFLVKIYPHIFFS